MSRIILVGVKVCQTTFWWISYDSSCLSLTIPMLKTVICLNLSKFGKYSYPKSNIQYKQLTENWIFNIDCLWQY